MKTVLLDNILRKKPMKVNIDELSLKSKLKIVLHRLTNKTSYWITCLVFAVLTLLAKILQFPYDEYLFVHILFLIFSSITFLMLLFAFLFSHRERLSGFLKVCVWGLFIASEIINILQ